MFMRSGGVLYPITWPLAKLPLQAVSRMLSGSDADH